MSRIRILLTLVLSFSLFVVSSAIAAPLGNPNTTHSEIATAPTLSTPAPTTIDTATPSGPPLSLTIALICFCLIFLAIIGILVMGVVLRNQNMKELNKDN